MRENIIQVFRDMNPCPGEDFGMSNDDVWAIVDSIGLPHGGDAKVRTQQAQLIANKLKAFKAARYVGDRETL